MNGIIYVRVSSKEQVEGTSLESQAAACAEYARSKNIKIVKKFIEQGESAKFADRTQLLALIDFCKENKGRLQALLVWKIDRFARNASDHFNIKAVLLKYGVRVVSVTEPIDENPEGKLLETILAGFAQFDNDIRAMRTVQGMRRKLSEVHLSLDAFAARNDAFRGAGNFDAAIRALEVYRAFGFDLKVLLTITRETLPELEEFLIFLIKRGFSSINVHWFRPIGRGRGHEEWCVNASEINQSIRQAFARIGARLPDSDVQESQPNCGVGRFLNIMPNGDVFPATSSLTQNFAVAMF